eukprot:COSAG01_NODE_711_length_14105_cov_5.661145_11_plen_55_part_00
MKVEEYWRYQRYQRYPPSFMNKHEFYVCFESETGAIRPEFSRMFTILLGVCVGV